MPAEDGVGHTSQYSPGSTYSNFVDMLNASTAVPHRQRQPCTVMLMLYREAG